MANSILNSFVSAEQRAILLPEWENVLLERWRKTDQASDKRIWYNAYTGIAQTEAALANLYQWWKEEKPVYGLNLNPADYRSLATRLALYQHPGHEEVMQEQTLRIKNTDDLARWNFVLPSLSADEEVRSAMFARLLEPANRGNEPWVSQAMSHLHHPTRQEEARKYLPEVLNKLEEVQLTGDIFFPKAWLDAALGGHNSREAAAIVHAFLDENPNFNPRLRQKLLQSADMLFRSAAIVQG
jgi:aminopeptidase N